ncbi:PREDICTED: lactose-binding lectin l-2-like [Poecilia mexicana]|uniref:lactose-binding lectin l-2-like n=1 Tax=Poecilia mexicana TaxID=48701 RepID=UPI00072E2A86|nr:PREDICTED: lactose-binding lectin l-2-like [Poecilia mexicana]
MTADKFFQDNKTSQTKTLQNYNMLPLVFLFALGLAAVPPSDREEVELVRGGCPMFWYSFNGRCYKYVASRMTWADAELHCLSEGGNLVSIHSLEEHNFVNNLIKNFDPTRDFTWIGLADVHKEGAWMWSDGSNYEFSLWGHGEPNNGNNGQEHCGHTNIPPDYYWNDHLCSRVKTFVCASRIICP